MDLDYLSGERKRERQRDRERENLTVKIYFNIPSSQVKQRLYKDLKKESFGKSKQ